MQEFNWFGHVLWIRSEGSVDTLNKVIGEHLLLLAKTDSDDTKDMVNDDMRGSGRLGGARLVVP